MTELAHISAMTIYPIKGCKGTAVDRIKINEMGLVGDREYGILLNGQIANQKNLPALYLLSASYLEGGELQLSYPKHENYTVINDVASDNTSASSDKVNTFGGAAPVRDLGNAVADWLSSVLNQPVRLVNMIKALAWTPPIDEFSALTNSIQNKFVDTSPLLITSEESLFDLNQKLHTSINMDRFRANIVIKNLAPYAEDRISILNANELDLKAVAPCERCIVTTIDQQTGNRNKEPLRTLSKYRKRRNGYAGGIVFGLYMSVSQLGYLTMGESLSAFIVEPT